MPDSNAVLEGGPVDGAVVYVDSRSLLVDGTAHDREGEVARYHRTNRRTTGGLWVYAFKRWDRIVIQIPWPPVASEGDSA